MGVRSGCADCGRGLAAHTSHLLSPPSFQLIVKTSYTHELFQLLVPLLSFLYFAWCTFHAAADFPKTLKDMASKVDSDASSELRTGGRLAIEAGAIVLFSGLLYLIYGIYECCKCGFTDHSLSTYTREEVKDMQLSIIEDKMNKMQEVIR